MYFMKWGIFSSPVKKKTKKQIKALVNLKNLLFFFWYGFCFVKKNKN